jgi:hypothetical protein
VLLLWLRGLLVWGVLGLSGLALARLLAPAAVRREIRVAMAWVLGPWVWTLLVGCLRWAGLDLALAGGIATAAAFLLSWWRPRTHPGTSWSPGTGTALGVSLALAALFYVAQGGRVTLWDSPFHVQMAEFLQVGTLPPENPFLAGRGLPYPWGMHLEAAALGRLVGLEPAAVFPVLNLHALAGLLLALNLCLPRSLGLRGRATVLLLAVWATNPLGWLAHVGRWFGGEVRGWEAVRESLLHPDTVLSQMSPGFDRRLAYPMHKFLEATPYALVLPLPFLAWWLLGRLARDGRAAHVVLLGLVGAAWLSLHFISAVLVWPALLLTVFLGLPPRSWPRTLGLAALAALGAVAATGPYLWATLGLSLRHGGGGALALRPDPHLAALVFCAAPFVLLAALGRRGFAHEDLPRGWVGRAAVAALLVGMLVQFTDHNEYKVLLVGLLLVPVSLAGRLEWLFWEAGGARRWIARGFLAVAGLGAVVVLGLLAFGQARPLYARDATLDAVLAESLRPETVLVGDLYAPGPWRWAAFLAYPTLQSQWGFSEELDLRRSALEALKGQRLRCPLGTAGRGRQRPAWPMERTRALERVLALGRPVAFVVPRGGWPGLPRAGLQPIHRGARWEVWLARGTLPEAGAREEP